MEISLLIPSVFSNHMLTVLCVSAVFAGELAEEIKEKVHLAILKNHDHHKHAAPLIKLAPLFEDSPLNYIQQAFTPQQQDKDSSFEII